MKSSCPHCGSTDVRPVVYESSGDWRPAGAWSGRAISASLIDEEAPNWECADCHHRWPDPDRLRACRELLGVPNTPPPASAGFSPAPSS